MSEIGKLIYSEIYRGFLIEIAETTDERCKGDTEYQLISPDGKVIEGAGIGEFINCLRGAREDVALFYRQQEIRARIKQEIMDFFIRKGFRDWEVGQALIEFEKEYNYLKIHDDLPPNLID